MTAIRKKAVGVGNIQT